MAALGLVIIMAIRRLGVRALGGMAAAGLVAGTITLAGGPAAGAVTCPTVGPGGVVTPAPAPRVDWSGCNLTGANLSNSDLREAFLTQASFANANLAGADLDHADFQFSSLASADLSGASMRNTALKDTNLSGANLSSANLYEVFSGGITATTAPTLPTGWQLISGYLAGPTANLDEAALGGADLSSADLAGAFFFRANLTGANLSDANLTSTDMVEADLAGANLSQANLTGATLAGVRSGGITASIAPQLPADWQLRSGFLAGPGADLQGANAAGADLAGTDLDGASLYGTILANANLTNANLTGVDAAGVDLENANLTGANLTDASIALAAFGAGLPNLQGANFSGATMTGLISADIGAGPAVLPARWTFADGLLLGPTADLKYGGYLANTDLTGVNLAFAKLGSAQFQHDNLTRAVFWGSDATAGEFYQDTWSDTVCPDGTNSNLYVAGCFSARLYQFAGLISPRPGSTLRKSVPRFRVSFRLDNAAGQRITGAVARALSARHDVRAVLAGPGISRVTVTCSWIPAAKYFACTFATPRRVRTGRSYAYSITIQENQGAGFVRAPPIRSAANPEFIHFR